MQIEKFVFHYTVGVKLAQIDKDGFLKTTPTETKLGERPLVWLSSNTDYERTSLKHFMRPGENETRLGTLEDMDRYCNGVYRFRFDTESLPEDLKALPWPVLKQKSRMKKKLIDRLVKRAKGVQAQPKEWYGVFGRLPISLSTLERLDINTGKWEPISMKEALSNKPKFQIGQVLDSEVPPHLRARDEHWNA